MIWVPHLEQSAIKLAEAKSKTPTELARALFIEVFKEELAECPDKVNCTKTPDNKKLLNQQYVRGIRRKYCAFFILKQAYSKPETLEFHPKFWIEFRRIPTHSYCH